MSGGKGQKNYKIQNSFPFLPGGGAFHPIRSDTRMTIMLVMDDDDDDLSQPIPISVSILFRVPPAESSSERSHARCSVHGAQNIWPCRVFFRALTCSVLGAHNIWPNHRIFLLLSLASQRSHLTYGPFMMLPDVPQVSRYWGMDASGTPDVGKTSFAQVWYFCLPTTIQTSGKRPPP